MENVSIGIIIHCGSFMMNHPIDCTECIECFCRISFFTFCASIILVTDDTVAVISFNFGDFIKFARRFK